MRALRQVRRFNQHQCSSYESVAEHSFFTGLLAYQLAQDLGMSTPALCLVAALLHDADEAVLGDIPFLVRRRFMPPEAEREALAELGIAYDFSPQIMDVVRFADAYELKMYLEEERWAGNSTLGVIEQETMYRLLHSPGVDAGVRSRWIARLDRVQELPVTEELLHGR